MRQDAEAVEPGEGAAPGLRGGGLAGGLRPVDSRGPDRGDSLSGHERNHLFLNRGGRDFEDIAAISGLDHPADGRALAALDYDRDGWVDFAVVNANRPQLQLFRNQIGGASGAAARDHAVIAVRFRGANRSDRPDPSRSNRDGYGAVFALEVGDATLVHEHRAGEGFAAQSSATRLVGLGPAREARSLRVRWPSARVQTHGPIPAYSLVTVFEDPTESADGSGFDVEPYRVPVSVPRSGVTTTRVLPLDAPADGDAPLRVWITMATWCEACTAELPQVALLRNTFGEDEVELLGVPVDEDDSAAQLASYREAHRPGYYMLDPIDASQRARVREIVEHALMIDALPATILTDREGNVVRTQARVPSVSGVRRSLALLSAGVESDALESAAGERALGGDARYNLTLRIAQSAPATGRLVLRVEPRQGWHLAPEAPASLELEPAEGTVCAPVEETAKTRSALSFEASFERQGTAVARATGRVKFGICSDADDRCVIVRRELDLELVPSGD